jgi:hypothetical protein
LKEIDIVKTGNNADNSRAIGASKNNALRQT